MPTSDQAKRLWCPMVRAARDEVESTESGFTPSKAVTIEHRVIVGGCNTDAIGKNRIPASCLCIADKCAMWRWAGGRVGNFAPGSMPPPLVRTEHGYCGLAGRPEVFE